MKKPIIFNRSSLALALSFALSATAHAQEFSQVIIFGDSLSDTGRIKELVTQQIPAIGNQLQPSFTTNPNPVWSQILAGYYGQTAIAKTNENPDGTNYAVGGSQSARIANWGGTPVQIPTTAQQIEDYQAYLTQTNKKIDPNALYAIWVGANDVFYSIETKDPANVAAAAAATAEDIKTLHQMGAKTILVPNIPDLSLTPLIEKNAPTAKPQVQLLTQMYNTGVFNALNQSNANIIPANTFALLQEAVANPSDFGLSHVTETACNPTPPIPHTSSSLACDKTKLVAADAGETHMFADLIHPSGKTHQILAQYYRAIIDSPAQMGHLSQKILNAGSINDRHLNRQLDRLDPVNSTWATLHASADGEPLVNVGLDVAGENRHTGAYVSHQKQDYRLSDTLTSDVKSVGVGVYHRQDFGNARLKANLGIDRLSVDTERHIAWDNKARVHTGDTSARRFHGGLQLDYGILVGQAQLRPYVGLHAQKVTVRELTESMPASSTAMSFGKQERESLQGELGLNVDYPITPKLTVTAGVGYAHEFNDDKTHINASLTSMREYAKGFDTSVSTDETNTTTAHLGVAGQLGRAKASTGIYTTHQDGQHHSDSDTGGFVSVAWAF